MTEDQYEKIDEVAHAFLDDVRRAFWSARDKLSEEEFDAAVYQMQDGLSLFSPWMNNRPPVSEEAGKEKQGA